MTRTTAMVTTMQDRLQDRSGYKRPTTSSDYVIRLTEGLLRLGSKISDCFFLRGLRVAMRKEGRRARGKKKGEGKKREEGKRGKD